MACRDLKDSSLKNADGWQSAFSCSLRAPLPRRCLKRKILRMIILLCGLPQHRDRIRQRTGPGQYRGQKYRFGQYQESSSRQRRKHRTFLRKTIYQLIMLFCRIHRVQEKMLLAKLNNQNRPLCNCVLSAVKC